jgi:hypothetical protein
MSIYMEDLLLALKRQVDVMDALPETPEEFERFNPKWRC